MVDKPSRVPNWSALLVGIALVAAGSVTVAPVARAACPGAAQPPDDGAGTYLVSSVAHLEWIRDANENGTDDQLGYNYRQTDDIDFSGCEWSRAIADGATDFTGSYDGDGNGIGNFVIRSSQASAGLFGDVNDAIIRDLTISGLVVNNGTGTADGGLLAGKALGTTQVLRVGVSGTVRGKGGGFSAGTADMGGVIGYGGGYITVDNVYSRADVSSDDAAGGVIGDLSSTGTTLALKRVYAVGTVTGDSTKRGGVSNRTTNRYIEGHAFCLESDDYDCMGNFAPEDNTSQLSATALRLATTFTGEGWDLTNGFSSDTDWSICSNINDGYPFLSMEYDASPCVPGLATDVTGSAGDAQVTVSWTGAPDNGNAITGYKIEFSVDSGATWQVANRDTGSSSTTATVTNLTNGTPYEFRVSAINGNGTGEASNVSSSVTPRSSGGGGSGGGGSVPPPAPSETPTTPTAAPAAVPSPDELLLNEDGSPLTMSAGSGAGYLNSSQLPEPLVTTENSLWTVAGDGFALQVAGPRPVSQQPRTTTSNPLPEVMGGQNVAVAVRGFAEGTDVRGWVITTNSLASAPPTVTWKADGTGSALGTVSMDPDQPGPQTLQFRGQTASGSTLTILFGLEVRAAPKNVRFAVTFKKDSETLTKRSKRQLKSTIRKHNRETMTSEVTIRRLRADGREGRKLARERRASLRTQMIDLGVPKSAINISIKVVKKPRFASRAIIDVSVD